MSSRNWLLWFLVWQSIEMNIHPLYLMLPATIATSFSFMLPVANPPNAITFTAAGNMKVSDMVNNDSVIQLLSFWVKNSRVCWAFCFVGQGRVPDEHHRFNCTQHHGQHLRRPGLRLEATTGVEAWPGDDTQGRQHDDGNKFSNYHSDTVIFFNRRRGHFKILYDE